MRLSKLNRRRRGVTSVLAMMYLVLFGTLAIGFYASTNTQSQVVANDSNMARAALAAETGIDFIRFHLQANVSIPSRTAEDMVLDEIHKDLVAALEPTGNFTGKTIGINLAKTEVQIPNGAGNYVELEAGGPRFRVTLRQEGRNVVATAEGMAGMNKSRAGSAKGMALTFKTEQITGGFFKYGMASAGPVVLGGNKIIQGVPTSYANVLSSYNGANSIQITKATGGTVGELTAIEGRTPSIVAGATVGGTTNATTIANEHIDYIKPAAAPEFPLPDTSIYKKFATSMYLPGKVLYENIYVPAGMNPVFSAGVEVRGVVYVEQPNIVQFTSTSKVTGIIVTEDTGLGVPGVDNSILLNGSGGAFPLSALPVDPKFNELKTLNGGFIIAPGFHVQTNGAFGSVTGHIVADSFTLNGNAAVTLNGSIVVLQPNALNMAGTAQLTFNENPDAAYNGLRFKEKLTPDPTTYREVKY